MANSNLIDKKGILLKNFTFSLYNKMDYEIYYQRNREKNIK